MGKPTNTTNENDSVISTPYVNAYGNIKRVLEKISTAATPDRFTHDFLGTKLGLTGGSATPLVPYLKRIGFLNSDGTPTELYKKFRNTSSRGAAAKKALESGYAALYEINEYAHELGDKELKGVIIQVTGLDEKSPTLRAIIGSFKALKDFADFNAAEELSDYEDHEESEKEKESSPPSENRKSMNLKLGYTINLNLPPTSDVAVFNAIFKALRENLLDND